MRCVRKDGNINLGGLKFASLSPQIPPISTTGSKQLPRPTCYRLRTASQLCRSENPVHLVQKRFDTHYELLASCDSFRRRRASQILLTTMEASPEEALPMCGQDNLAEEFGIPHISWRASTRVEKSTRFQPGPYARWYHPP